MANTLFDNITELNTQKKDVLYYVTNNYNIREILTSQYIGSRYAYDDKYYNDFLEYGKGNIPLFKSPLSAELVSVVNQHDPQTSYAVILELESVDFFQQQALHLTSEGDSLKSQPSDKTVCVAWTKTIPFSLVKAIHFLSEHDRSEFETRNYDEMPKPSDLFRVTPELLGDGLNVKQVTDWLINLESVADPGFDTYALLERKAGAVVLSSYVLKGSGTEELLQFIKTRTAPGLYLTKKLPYWFSNGLNSTVTSDLKGGLDVEQSLFAATVSVLCELNSSETFLKSEILQRIESAFHKINTEEKDRYIISKVFNNFGKYFSNTQEIMPVAPQRNYDVARALLLFLMRPKPDNLLNWSRSETGADDNIMVTAACFAGLVEGRKGLSLEYRKDIDQKLSEAIVEHLNSFIVRFEVSSGDPHAPIDTNKNKEDNPSSRKSKAEKESKSVGSGKINNDIKQLLLDADLSTPGSQLDLALAMCRHMKWGDCVESVIICPDEGGIAISQEANRKKKVMAVRVAGYAEVEYILNEDLFKVRLDSTDKSDKNFKKALKILQY